MLKLKKKKGSEVKAEIDPADDTVKAFIDDWLADFCKDHPEFADKLAGPLIMKSALDSALDNGVYRMNDDEVLETLATKAGVKKQNKGSKGRGKKTPDSKRKVINGKGLRKPHTSI